MSQKHPIVVVTGSSGAGTSTVKHAFEQIFIREKIDPVIIEGDSFHRYDRAAMKEAMTKAEAEGNDRFSHFGADANLFDKLEELFKKMELRPCQGDDDLSQKEQDMEDLKDKINAKKMERDQYKYSV